MNTTGERDPMDLYDEIKDMIVKAVAVEDEVVLPDAHLQDDLGADSLAILNLAEAIGERYGIEIEGDEIVEVDNVGGLVKLVESKVSSKS
jgi:acyl carrier protein